MIWYAIRVTPQREFMAENLLKDDGFYAFVPILHRLHKQARYAKRRVLVRSPVLPGIVFVGFEQERKPEWFRLFRFRMVHSVIGDQGKPLEIPGEQMVKVFAMEQRPQRYHRSQFGRRRFKAKHDHEITNGPYAGRTVKVTEITGNRATQIFELLKSPYGRMSA